MSIPVSERPTEAELQADIAAIGRIDAIPTILEVICRTTGMGFAAVARVTEERWIACAVHDEIAFGLTPGGELAVKSTICDEIRDNGTHVVINQVSKDQHFRTHHTPLQYGFESYISMPINLPSGEFFGTLCAIDPRPAEVDNAATIGMFRMFAQLIAFHLDALNRISANESELRDAKRTAELREQFIAILGHDLRNPLASIDAGATALSAMPLGDSVVPIVSLIQRSTARMTGLINDVLDFARGRLGGGLTLNKPVAVQLTPTLSHVVQELQAAWPEREIHSDLSLAHEVSGDPARIAQLASNLLANALVHGQASSPVTLHALSTNEYFELYVENAGTPIPKDTVDRLFLPFYRSTTRSGQQGLGLGLYIASQIAKAHGGTLSVQSDSAATRFTFRMSSRS